MQHFAVLATATHCEELLEHANWGDVLFRVLAAGKLLPQNKSMGR